MYSLRKWIFRPKRTDSSYLAQFFHSDEELNMVASELDSFDGRKDPERCNALVNQLRMCQDKVLTIVEKIMDEVITERRANRDFRVKFPDDVLQESLAGQLWFGAECLAAGSSIMNREVESASMRPLAKALTRHLDYLRSLLRDQCLRNHNSYTDKIKEGLVVFDKLFAEFELSYVSAMVPVKTMKEYDVLQEVIVLFSETTQRAMKLNLLTQDMIDDYDPALMFTIPRLAIICGLLIYPEGPLNPDMDPMNMSEMFRPFQTLLYKIRELLWTLSREELWLLEKALCSAEEPGLYRNFDPINFQEDCDLAEIPDWYYPPNLSSKTEASIGETLRTRLHRDNPFTGQLGADILEAAYGTMSQSPSVQTIVSNPNYRGETDTLSEGTMEELEGATGPNVEQSEVHKAGENDEGAAAVMVKQPGIEGSTIAEETKETAEQEGADSSTEHAGAAAAVSDSRSLRHSLSWPESRRRGRMGRLSEGEAQILNYDADSMEDEAMVDPSLHLTASTHEFNFHLPLNTERVRPESSEHEYEIPTVSVERRTPSAPAPGVVSNLQRIFITSDGQREVEEQPDLSQISFVTDALTDVFITDFNFNDSSKDGGKGSKMKNTRRNTDDTVNSEAVSTVAQEDPEKVQPSEDVTSVDPTSAKMNMDNHESHHNNANERLGPRCDNDAHPVPTTSTTLPSVDVVSPQQEDSIEPCDVKHVAEDDVKVEDLDEEEYALSTESETDDYKVSQKAAQAQGRTVVTVEDTTCLETENKSDDDKGAILGSGKSTDIEQMTDLISSVEEKSETELCEKGTDMVVNNASVVERCRLREDSNGNCDKTGDTSDGHTLLTLADRAATDSAYRQDNRTPDRDTSSQEEISRVQRLKYSEISNSVGMNQIFSGTVVNVAGVSEFDWDRESYSSSETSSYTSECQDDEEIALAIQAAELAARREARARFKSSADLIHRLFVCISGVADQLQTNYASDLRHILKAVFECNASEPYIPIDVATATDFEETNHVNDNSPRNTTPTNGETKKKKVPTATLR